ncbi:Fatty acid desaturase 4, chloroplastic [Vitis vinifera]|uniref:Fatty acid desaturase 4, chloroplastic n=1 Tax=Vitis vinifera TaxID=29760 RepID=A0A438ISA2_VITVI|nr:Fatty acid desaturase 4, chloroplastic [Vitis vinifera]
MSVDATIYSSPPLSTAQPPPLPRPSAKLANYGFTTVLISLVKRATGSANSHMWLEPVFAGLIGYIEAFQGHHKWHWTITRLQFANNLHALAHAVTFTVLPPDLAHGTKSRLPPLVVALQDAGLLVSRSQHAAHHHVPYNNNYCIVSGVWKEFLDENKVFEALEMILFFQLGVRPRSWSEPNFGWIEEIETPSQTTVY